MELRSYWTILLRRLWIIVLVVAVVAIYAAYQYYHLRNTPGALKTYQSNVILRIGLVADAHTNSNQSYADYVATSDTLAVEFATGPVLSSQEFTTKVYQQIQADKTKILQRYPNADLSTLQPATLSGTITASRSHNLVTITVTQNTAPAAWAVAQAVGEVSTANINAFLDYGVRAPSSPTAAPGATPPLTYALVMSPAADPATIPGPAANKPTLLLMLVLVALIIGIALAFFIEYLDDRIRSKDEVEQLLQLPTYGEIPRAPALGKGRVRGSSAV